MIYAQHQKKPSTTVKVPVVVPVVEPPPATIKAVNQMGFSYTELQDEGLSDGILIGIDNDALLITEASKTCARIPSSSP